MKKPNLKQITDKLKYLMPSLIVENKNNMLCLRSRLLHRGYSLSSRTTYRSMEGSFLYTHIAHFDTLKQTETFISNEYGVKVNL